MTFEDYEFMTPAQRARAAEISVKAKVDAEKRQNEKALEKARADLAAAIEEGDDLAIEQAAAGIAQLGG